MKTLTQFAESKELQDKGSALRLGNAEETVIYVRRANHKWEEALLDCKRYMFGVYYNEATLTAEQRNEAVAMAISEYLVAGWDNMINDETGKEIPFSIPNAKAIFGNRDMHLSLNMFILGHASNFENYLYSKIEEDKELVKKQ